MKFSYNWLRDLVQEFDTPPQKLERLITLHTAECEGIEPVGAQFSKVVAARVLSVAPLPKGKNKLAAVDVGNGSTKRVVCGAPNVREGARYALSAWYRLNGTATWLVYLHSELTDRWVRWRADEAIAPSVRWDRAEYVTPRMPSWAGS